MHNKGNYKQGERQPSEWEKILANEATDKESQKYTRNLYKSIAKQMKSNSKNKQMTCIDIFIYNGKKITSLTSGVGKFGQPLVKEWN